jgi:pimeloyl-ACP methyl ester carboxylesterase
MHSAQRLSTADQTFDFSFVDSLAHRDIDGCRLYEPFSTSLPSARRPRLLFVPGGYHGAWCYANYLRYCVDNDIVCATVDLAGHGALAPDPALLDLSVVGLGQQVIAAFDALPGPTVVVGHSLGGLLAALCATHRAVAGLVLLAPSPPGNLPGAQGVAPLPVDTACPPPTDIEIRKRFLGSGGDEDVDAIAARLCDESPRVLNDRYLLRVQVDPAQQHAPGICIAAGRDTPDRHPKGQDRAVADFLGLSYLRLDDAPHCMMYAAGWEHSMAAIHTWYRNTFN